jgi:hypothetical protein
MVTGTVQLEDEQETKHSGNAPRRFAPNQPEPKEPRRNQLERALEEIGMVVLMDPTARTRWMREGNGDRPAAQMLDVVLATYEFVERDSREEALDGEASHRNHETWPDQTKLIVEPARAVRPLDWRRNTIPSAAGTWPRITARYRGDINPVPRGSFVETDALQPAKERLPGAAGERAAAARLDFAWRLADEHRLRPAGQ